MRDLSIYTIHVKGHLSRQWMSCFPGMDMFPVNLDETCLCGPVTDQAALHGMLACIRDLGLVLTFVQRIEIDPHLNNTKPVDKNISKDAHVLL